MAILDTGVDASHPDLEGQVLAGTSFLPGSAWSDDPNGHGTAMAGIVAAETDNGAGIAGVGYEGVGIMPVTVLAADGTGQDSDVIEGLVWAADHGADVILMAFSNPSFSASLQLAVDYAWDMASCWSPRGNDSSSTTTYPAGDAGVVGVSATNADDQLAGFSNSGADTFLAAPGIDIPASQAGGGVTSRRHLHRCRAGGRRGGPPPRQRRRRFRTASSWPASAATPMTPARPPEKGNGRLDLARALFDTSADGVKPAGAPAVGRSWAICGGGSQ